MTTDKYPVSGPKRADRAKDRRTEGVTLNAAIEGHQTANNGDNVRFGDTHVMAFTKGLDHAWETGFAKSADVETFDTALTQPGPNGAETQRNFTVPKSLTSYVAPMDMFRVWESPLSGMAYENEGPDPDAVSMAPAPKFGETELCAEMLEVYAMALVRDMSFSALAQPGSPLTYVSATEATDQPFTKDDDDPALVSDLIDTLNAQNWFKTPSHVTTSLGEDGNITMLEQSRQSARGEDGAPTAAVTTQTLFRGSSPGCKDGPYISQFLLQGAGTKGPGGAARDKDSGQVSFGAQSISQKVSTNTPGVDWMTSWHAWISVQNGVNVAGQDRVNDAERFISTPRDLATYVHIDQLYQAYFVACLMLLEEFGEGDAGFPEPNGARTRAPFATFGGPHVLSLMTEVASRGLRAVRRQKFQVHRRARPERLAAMITVAKGHAKGLEVFGNAKTAMISILNELGLNDPGQSRNPILGWIDALNTDRNGADPYGPGLPLPPNPPIADGHNYLLPMAFPEGSPMHPAYGAGHATVAGACTTVLKAFFNIYDVMPMPTPHAQGMKPTLRPKTMPEIGFEHVYEGNATSKALDEIADAEVLTVEGELNKLAANIAIGRNFAGVHYYTDYYDSVRMGERVAVGILREHLISHPEYVAMHLRSFDGDTLRISTKGDGETQLEIWNTQGVKVDENVWWTRDVSEFAKRPLTPSDAPELQIASAEDDGGPQDA